MEIKRMILVEPYQGRLELFLDTQLRSGPRRPIELNLEAEDEVIHLTISQSQKLRDWLIRAIKATETMKRK